MLAEIFNLLLSFVSLLLPRRTRETDIKAFYSSWEWKRLRYDALKKYGRVCRCCRTTEGKMVVDHIKPIRTHWHLRLVMSNTQILCDSCNRGKGSRCDRDWR